MKAVLQRVKYAKVYTEGNVIGEIGPGLLVLLGIAQSDSGRECDFLCEKTAMLRIFEDENGKMNRSVCDIRGGVLVVSQFTLLADCKNGRRPSFSGAMKPCNAIPLYTRFLERMEGFAEISQVAKGEFGAEMQVELQNDGPVTILLDTDEIMPQKA